MYSCLKSYGIDGIDAFPVTVEATFGRAMPGFDSNWTQNGCGLHCGLWRGGKPECIFE